jgi:multidrug efflux pump subunit AcrB
VVRVWHRAVGETTSVGALGPNARMTGSHVGAVTVELVDTAERNVHSREVLSAWRKEAGEFPGAERLVFDVPQMGPAGLAIEFKLLAPPDKIAELEELAELAKARIREAQGAYDVADDLNPGKWEYQLRVKERAMAMGVPLGDLAETVRAAYYGEEVMRLQRGRHEVKLMVRYPHEERRSLAAFDEIRVRTGDGAERPLSELAEVTVARGAAEINRLDQLRSITISANVDKTQGNAREIMRDLQANFFPPLLAQEKYTDIRVRWEGEQERTNESLVSLGIGLVVAIIAMFVLLTMEFRSYAQPLLILAIIPFGAMGAIWGHGLLGLPLTLFSVFGLVALTGVVVNDSIVLIDFINHRIKEGQPLRDALIEAGQRRFRPVLLTSVTTVAGLMPILLERSFQAQILIPMAASLCFGLMLTTVLVLTVIPVLYLLYDRYLRELFVLRENEQERRTEKAHAETHGGDGADTTPLHADPAAS